MSVKPQAGAPVGATLTTVEPGPTVIDSGVVPPEGAPPSIVISTAVGPAAAPSVAVNAVAASRTPGTLDGSRASCGQPPLLADVVVDPPLEPVPELAPDEALPNPELPEEEATDPELPDDVVLEAVLAVVPVPVLPLDAAPVLLPPEAGVPDELALPLELVCVPPLVPDLPDDPADCWQVP